MLCWVAQSEKPGIGLKVWLWPTFPTFFENLTCDEKFPSWAPLGVCNLKKWKGDFLKTLVSRTRGFSCKCHVKCVGKFIMFHQIKEFIKGIPTWIILHLSHPRLATSGQLIINQLNQVVFHKCLHFLPKGRIWWDNCSIDAIECKIHSQNVTKIQDRLCIVYGSSVIEVPDTKKHFLWLNKDTEYGLPCSSYSLFVFSEFIILLIKDMESLILEKSAWQIEMQQTVLIKSITPDDNSEFSLKVKPLFRLTRTNGVDINHVSVWVWVSIVILDLMRGQLLMGLLNRFLDFFCLDS